MTVAVSISSSCRCRNQAWMGRNEDLSRRCLRDGSPLLSRLLPFACRPTARSRNGGMIDAMGEGVQLRVGAPLAVEPQCFCGECYQCHTGNHNRCAKRILFGVTGRGGCAGCATIPAYAAYLLPDDARRFDWGSQIPALDFSTK